jgi:putative PIN family toxin of toxin-antitoxin system
VRVVLDTNIWVSGQLWRGLPWKLLRLAEAGRVEPCMTPEMLTELAEVLAYERLQPRLHELGLEPVELVTHAMSLSTFFDISTGPVIVTADPDDDIFLRCAEVAGAIYIVSGDRHLLDLKHYANIPIVTVHDFLTAEFPTELM